MDHLLVATMTGHGAAAGSRSGRSGAAAGSQAPMPILGDKQS
jgi:uncharacterized ParB-like nuclease family protein